MLVIGCKRYDDKEGFMSKIMSKIVMVFVVMNSIGIAVALFLESGLGSDSVGLLCDGIRHTFLISFGNASLFYNLLIILIACLVARKNMGLGTVVYALVSGYFIDFYSWILTDIHLAEQDMLIRILAFAIGQCCLSLGLALLIQLNLGMNALDAVLYKIQNHTNFSYTIMRTGCDISYVVIGTVLGGTFGAGTICSVLVTGTMVTMITNIIGRIQKYEYKWRYETN
jgi:uncharacterized membrane protein YczE